MFTFTSTHLGPFGIIQPRTKLLPYIDWNIRPDGGKHGDKAILTLKVRSTTSIVQYFAWMKFGHVHTVLRMDSIVTLIISRSILSNALMCINVLRALYWLQVVTGQELMFEIMPGLVKLLPNPMLEGCDLFNSQMTPSNLLQSLALYGINLMPEDRDIQYLEGRQLKTPDTERGMCADIGLIRWNQMYPTLIQVFVYSTKENSLFQMLCLHCNLSNRLHHNILAPFVK